MYLDIMYLETGVGKMTRAERGKVLLRNNV